MRGAAAVLWVLIAVAIGGATAGAGAALRVPGTPLRFGAPIGSLDTTFTAGPTSTDTLAQSRRGPVTWFGVHATVTLSFRDGRLAEAAFEADSTSPATRAYIEDELAREGYRRRCARWDPDAHVCDWSGRAEIHLELSPRSLRATMKEAEPAPVAAALPASPAPATTVAPERTGPMTAREMEALARRAAQPTPPAPRPGGPAAPRIAAAARETVTVEEDLPMDIIAHMDDDSPSLLDSCIAVRPEAARRAGVFGTVTVKVGIDTTGAVSTAAVVRGVRELDQAALACARRYRFTAWNRNGRPPAFDRVITIRFTQ